jgi:hypothetical protein
LGIALALQLAQLYYIPNRCLFFWKAQHRFLIGYVLLVSIIYFEVFVIQVYNTI